MPNLTLPIVHLNGDTAETLFNGYRNAYDAIAQAIDVVCKEASPNGRNFYPISPIAMGKAIQEHSERVRKLQEVRDEFLELAEHVQHFLKE